ncbi:MAG: ABC transporter ATP-binding protein [Deltaproteobacteria bacterium]|nr:ABC transporter ATP-binding protein [Deltaproteobacteria bacterium]
MPPFLHIESMSKWYGQVIALNDIDFESDVPILGLLGPNGAGKSSLLKLLVGLSRPSRGKVEVFGLQPWQNHDLLAGLGYTPEHHKLYDRLTPIQFVSLLLQLSGYLSETAYDMAARAIEQLALGEKKDAPIHTLSHGMRQRVKLAQAIAHHPSWLVLDEPLTGMDPLGRNMTIEMVRRMAAEGTRVIVSSHVLHELEALTSDILLLNRGRLLAQGSVAEIRELIDEHPHRILIKSENIRSLGRELAGYDYVKRIEFEPGHLVVETDRPDDFYTMIGELAAGDDFIVHSMISLDDNLEAVFRYLVK